MPQETHCQHHVFPHRYNTLYVVITSCFVLACLSAAHAALQAWVLSFTATRSMVNTPVIIYSTKPKEPLQFETRGLPRSQSKAHIWGIGPDEPEAEKVGSSQLMGVNQDRRSSATGRLQWLKALENDLQNQLPTADLFANVAWKMAAGWPKSTTLSPGEKEEVAKEFRKVMQPMLMTVPTCDSLQLCTIMDSLGNIAMLDWDMMDNIRPVVKTHLSHRIVHQHILHSFSALGLVKVFWSLSRLQMYEDPAVPIICQRFLEAKLLSQLHLKHLTQLLWALGRMGFVHHQLLDDIARCILELDADSLDRVSVATIVWAMGKLNYQNERVLQVVMDAIANNASLLPARTFEMINVVWGFARLRLLDQQVMKVLMERLWTTDMVQGMTGWGVSRLCWSLGRLKYLDQEGMEILGALITSHHIMTDLNRQGLCHVPWCFATLGVRNEMLMNVLAIQLLSSGDVAFLTSQHVAILCWSYAKLNIKHEALMSALSKRAQNPSVLSGFTQHGIALVAWAFSRLDIFDKQLLDVIAQRVATPEMSKLLTTSASTNLAWAFANIRYAQPLLFETVARAFLMGQALDFLTDRHISNIAWSFSKVRILNREVMSLISVVAVAPEMQQQFTMQGITNVAAAFARFRIRDTRLLTRLAEQVCRLDGITPYTAHNIAITSWAFAILGVRDEEMMQTLARRAVTQQVLATFTAVGLVLTAWAFTHLGMKYVPLLPTLGRQLLTTNLHLNLGAPLTALLAWTWAKAELKDKQMMAFIANEVMSLSQVNQGDLAKLTWAFATQSLYRPQVMERLACIAQSLQLNAPEAAVIAWGFAALGHYDGTLMLTLLNTAPQVAAFLAPEDAPMLVWGMAELGRRAPKSIRQECALVMRRLASFVMKPELVSACTAEDRISMAWSFLRSGVVVDQLLEALVGPLVMVPRTELSEIGRAQLEDIHNFVNTNANFLPRLSFAFSALPHR
eukprot:GGOE01001771.1.p1 GENE.GGOE01001771.1~~GGOE01001771.1.p1  ORF type:complete len:962 (-),score=186.11 GGOE01001771.1:279-3164(-)